MENQNNNTLQAEQITKKQWIEPEMEAIEIQIGFGKTADASGAS